MDLDAACAPGAELMPSADEPLTAGERRRWMRRIARVPAVDRSPDLIEELYRREAPRFRRVAFAIVRNAEVAEDVVQEAFTSALLRRRSFRGSGDASGWLWRIVVNGALSRRRRWQVEARLRERPEREACAAPEIEPADRQLRDFVARLPERQKLALFLRYYADLDYDAIAQALAIAPGTVGKLLHDARSRIRTALAEEADG
ncbi:MAG TPA: sigma-70 family RNA polymerase sigma factor [Gaiellaceae bacterium]|nr:sigma-70 family RNA polymerase sigma factor [Gaiellaceae bacterium]